MYNNPNQPQPPYGQGQSSSWQPQPQYGIPPVPDYVAPQPPRKRRRWLWIVLGALVVLLLGCAGGVFLLVSGLNTYTGNGYTIGYPKLWNAMQHPKNGSITFASGPNTVPELNISVSANPNGASSADQVLAIALTAVAIGSLFSPDSKCQPIPNFPKQVTVGGDTWAQGALTCMINSNGQIVQGEVVMLIDNHPAHTPTTKQFTITYATFQQQFDQDTSQYFQPMLQSFTFV